MSTDRYPTIPSAPGLLGKGKSQMQTQVEIDVSGGREVVSVATTAAKPAAQDVTVSCKLDLSSARELRDDLDQAIEQAER